jgi:hypothetical protein
MATFKIIYWYNFAARIDKQNALIQLLAKS